MHLYVRPIEQVIDGTTCDLNDDVPRVCVDGECVAVGCDGELGGDKREDKCRVCGGQGENCNTVEGVLDDKVGLKPGKVGPSDLSDEQLILVISGVVDGLQRPSPDPARGHQHPHYGV